MAGMVIRFIFILGFILFLRLIGWCCFSIITVDGHSMYPTIKSGEKIIVLRIFSTKMIKKGQIIVGDFGKITDLKQYSIELNDLPLFQIVPDGRNKTETTRKFVKRVAGLPGDVVGINESESKTQLYLRENLVLKASKQISLEIPQGHCFVRGDGPVGIDSTVWGPIPLDILTGIVVMKFPSN